MLLLLISKRICFLGCVFLICLACLQQSVSSKDIFIQEQEKAIARFNQLAKWPLSPLGVFASDIVGLFMINSTKALNETLNKEPKSQIGFISHAMALTLANQIGVTICVVVGILICLLLLFLPCLFRLYRNRQRIALVNSVSDKRIDSRSKGLLLFEIFIICIAVAVLGAVIVIIASIRSYLTLVVPFGFANFTVQAAFKLKTKLLVNHQNRLNEVSRSAFDIITLLNNVNEDISSDFMKRIHAVLQPVLNIATSVNWELIKVIQLLETEATLFRNFINETATHSSEHVDKFINSVKELKIAVGESAVLDSLMNITKLNISDESADKYLGPVPTLREVSKLNMQSGLQEFSTKLKQVVIQVQYDPSVLVEKLKHAAFKVQKNLDESTAKYITYINAHVNDSDRDPLLAEIGKVESESHSAVFIFNLVILVLALVSLVLAIVLVISYHGGVCGTSCFRIVRERNRKVILRSNASHRSGKAVLFFSYLISVFLWVFWLSCVVLFFLTSLPLTCCRSMNDYSILDMTFDSLKLRSTPGWYSLLTSDVFNMTLKQTVIRCQNDSTFVPTLPDPLVDTTDQTQIKYELNFTDLVAKFSVEVQKVPYENLTAYDLTKFNLTNIFDNVDISPPFTALQDFVTYLGTKNVSKTLDEIKKGDKAEIVSKFADTVQRVYDSMISNVSTALANKETFSSKINSADVIVNIVTKHVSYLNWTADALYSSVINDSVGYFDTALNTILNKFIDGIFVEMQLAAVDYRKSMSLCNAIKLFYEKATAIFCNVLLYPLACCWFGFFLLDVFLFIAIMLSMKSVKYFLFLPDVFQEERSVAGVKAEDLATKSTSTISSSLEEHGNEESMSPKNKDPPNKSRSHKENEDESGEDKKNKDPPTKSRNHKEDESGVDKKNKDPPTKSRSHKENEDESGVDKKNKDPPTKTRSHNENEDESGVDKKNEDLPTKSSSLISSSPVEKDQKKEDSTNSSETQNSFKKPD